MIEGLRTVVYFVRDLQKAKAWYTTILGKAPYFDEPFYVGFNVGGFELGLHPAGDDNKKGSTTYWGVKDAAKAIDMLLTNGAVIHDPIEAVGEGIVVASVKDPEGNIFGIIENPFFKLEEEK
jgi:predicted enzyme related to lactoylglutathione lyase